MTVYIKMCYHPVTEFLTVVCGEDMPSYPMVTRWAADC